MTWGKWPIHWGQLGFSYNSDAENSEKKVFGGWGGAHSTWPNPVDFSLVPTAATTNAES